MNWANQSAPAKIVETVLASLGSSVGTKTFLIDTTTGDPDITARRGERLASSGIRYLDATIAGSSQQMRQREVVIMVGGRTEDVGACSDLLDALASDVFHVGEWGSGARMKLVVNLAIGLNRAVLAEALALARLGRLDLETTLRVLKASPSYSRMMDTKGEKMLRGDFEPEARLAQHLKDVRLMLKQARDQNAELPLSELHQRLLESLVDRGFGHMDNSVVFRAYDP